MSCHVFVFVFFVFCGGDASCKWGPDFLSMALGWNL